MEPAQSNNERATLDVMGFDIVVKVPTFRG